MNDSKWKVFAAICAVAMALVSVVPAGAQTAELKEKPRMYSYVGEWSIPRAQWGDMEKSIAMNEPILQKALAGGTLVGYGYDTNLVHQADGPTHDSWWSSMSLAGLLNVLEQFHQSGNSTNPVLAGATKHWDNIYVSRFYNWQPGTWKGAYTHGSYYKLKADAPNDAVEMLSKNVIGPVLEKLLADGTIHEYEIDTESIHTESPDGFWVFYIAANAEALDKAGDAVREAAKANPLRGPAFGSMIDYSTHRDYLVRTTATYK